MSCISSPSVHGASLDLLWLEPARKSASPRRNAPASSMSHSRSATRARADRSKTTGVCPALRSLRSARTSRMSRATKATETRTSPAIARNTTPSTKPSCDFAGTLGSPAESA
eukprot:Amastigsp_a1111_10.p4 type:complete len:112 gc:universal Amastigsp_a1111_10:955-620(-)